MHKPADIVRSLLDVLLCVALGAGLFAVVIVLAEAISHVLS